MPVVEIDGRELSVSNLDKVLYPEVGFTKAEVIDYYVRVAPAMLPHVTHRGVTLRRYPDGVEGPSFFEKRSPDHRPDWIGTALGPGDRKGGIHYLVIDEVATLAWVGNMAALEVHAPMARAPDIDSPTMVVFDLDPGPGNDIVDCCRVALDIRDVLDDPGQGRVGVLVRRELVRREPVAHGGRLARDVRRDACDDGTRFGCGHAASARDRCAAPGRPPP